MTWNHRVFKQKDKTGEWLCFIGEAYYDNKGKFDGGYSGIETILLGDSLDDLKEVVAMVTEALKQPIIELPGVYEAEWERILGDTTKEEE